MSAREWKPGDVAMVSDEGALIKVGRPLVVIDTDQIPVAKGELTPTWLRNLARQLRGDDSNISTSLENVLTFLADEIDRQVGTKPDEPTGLGAVVEDADGVLWVRIYTHGACNDWRTTNDEPGGEETDARRVWSDITAVRVLSEGIS